MIWQLVSRMVPRLGQPFIDIREKYLCAAHSEPSSDRWKRCLGRTKGVLGFAIARMYVDEYATESDMEMVRQTPYL